MKNLPLFGIVIAIFFIFLGINLIQKEDTFSVIVGYANVIVFSGLIIFALYKLLSNKNKNKNI
jgi:FtsH-binding integral membrane protein